MAKSKWFGIVLCGAGALAAAVYAQDKNDKPAAKNAKESAPADPKEVTDKVSYGFGYNQGKRLLESGIKFNSDLVAKGFADAFGGKDSQYTQEELEAAFTAFERARVAEQQEKLTRAAEENQKKGEAFLAENKKKEGVKATKSGLQYKVLKSGKEGAASPKASDQVTTHYEGRLIDGTVFDSSLKRGEPASFPLNRVIKGWTEALQLMKVGDKWRIFVPSELAYGESPPFQGGPIGPNETLIFDIELIEVEEAAEEQGAAPNGGLKLNNNVKLKSQNRD